MISVEKKFRISRDPKEIFLTFEKFKKKNVLLWYQLDGVRQQLRLTVSGLNLTTRQIGFDPSEPIKGLASGDTCYLKLGEDDSVGKCRVFLCSERKLILHLPVEMVYREFRKNKRHRFKKTDDKQVLLQIRSKWAGAGLDSPHWYEVIDISEKGFCIFVPVKEFAPFLDDARIFLNQINEFKLETPPVGEVSRRNHFERKTVFGVEKGYKVAIRLNVSIPEEPFQDFVYTEKMINLNPEKFFKDREFREKIHQNMEQTVQKLSKRQNLAQKLALLEIKREGNQYLKMHIELLSELTCEVGRMLGWITAQTAEKMIYCSYLHDIRYFEKPHLAKLKYPVEFNRKKGELSAEDIAAFLEGPSYAMEIAKDDDSASPDCQKILLQQGELPDGSGFPLGIRGAQMVPLACLFIVCHALVDYILEFEDWTIQEFLSRARPVYKGLYFLKILQAVEQLGEGVGK